MSAVTSAGIDSRCGHVKHYRRGGVKPQRGLYNARSDGTSFGMLRWYMTVPRCRCCCLVFLVDSFWRGQGVCARCKRAQERGDA